MIVHQHEAAEFGAEMAIGPRRQGRQDRAPIRRDPALTRVARAEITSSCTRNGSWPLKHDPAGTAGALITGSSIMTRGVTLPRNRRVSLSAGFTGCVALSMPRGLMAGRPFKPFRRAI